jgi:hypothetical protein
MIASGTERKNGASFERQGSAMRGDGTGVPSSARTVALLGTRAKARSPFGQE